MGWIFPSPTETKRVLTPSILSSLKGLQDHLLWFKEFAYIVGNISTTFWLATIEKEATKEVMQKNLQELTGLKGQLLQLHKANR